MAAVSQGWFGPAQPLFARLRGRPENKRPVVDGHVLSAQVVAQPSPEGGTLYAVEVRFLYNVHARTREGRWTSPAQSSLASVMALAGRYTRGITLTVTYDPKDPTKAELPPPD